MSRFGDTRAIVTRAGWVLLGILMYALGLDLFLEGNNIAAGGLTGIAVVLRLFLPFNISAMLLVMNIPGLIFAWRINGWRYTAVTLGVIVLFAGSVELASYLPTLTDDLLVAAVFGGVLYGVGIVALALGRASTGGTDLICRLLVKIFPRISLGKMILMVEAGIVIFAMVAFHDIEVGLYAIITIVVSTSVADRLMLGLDKGCICMVVTAGEGHDIANALMAELHRAVTKVEGMGMYAQTQRNILYIAVRPKETVRVKQLLSQIDPNAFVVVMPANEVLGGTFRVKNAP